MVLDTDAVMGMLGQQWHCYDTLVVNYRIEKVITEGHYSVKPSNTRFYYFFTFFTW